MNEKLYSLISNAETQRRKGRIIDSQDDVGGYPVVEKRERKLDVPTDVASRRG